MGMRHAAVVAGLALGLMSGTAKASYLITFSQNSTGVTVTGTGDIDTLILGSPFRTNDAGPNIDPSGSNIQFAVGSADSYNATFSGPASFGGGSFTPANSANGDVTTFNAGFGYIDVPANYVSGSLLSSSMVFNGATYASLGVMPGTYTYTYSGQDEIEVDYATRAAFTLPANTIRVVIPGGALSTVPLPASAPLFGAALIAFGAAGYGLKRKSKAAAQA